jgi:predicted DsbA family dithiol-disulfide isomerase
MTGDTIPDKSTAATEGTSTGDAPMVIDFWSDVVCPWCGLMDHRLRAAKARAPFGSRVTVRHHSFQLHPDLPREGLSQRALFTKVGLPQSEVERNLLPIERMAREEGLIPYRAIDRTLGPTDLAHELLAYATDKGHGDEAWGKIFRAHFGQARKLWTVGEVVAFAAEIGLDAEEAAEVLRDRRYRARVNADQRDARRLGAHGTPFLVLDGRYAIPGAVDTNGLLTAMTRAWEQAHPKPAPLPVLIAEGQACTPDGCA